ncbi:serine-rich adhesin for platelets isoform X1 [Eurosta solidaginis]|uniref:serine-rich adhesin for platelets isoform X1 n=1 Tax=Eurosta solidaginis TaxID=178769 RepID=UPI00353121F6
MTKFSFTLKRVLPRICLYAFLLLYVRHGYGAPTHHLTVSVEGNTPTLIATSAEIGITPKIVHATTTATPVSTTTALTTTEMTEAVTPLLRIDEYGNKVGAKKLKGKSYKMQYSKKWQNAMKEREKKQKIQTSAQESLLYATASTNTEEPIQRAESAASAPKYSLKTTTHTTTQTIEKSMQGSYTGKVNIFTPSSSISTTETVTVSHKPKQAGSKRIAPDVVNTPDAIMSSVVGNMSRSTEPATRVNLASTTTATAATTAIETTTKTTTATQSIISTSAHPTALEVEQSTQSTGVGPTEKVTLARDTTLAEKDTTAAAVTKHTSPKTTKITPTPVASMTTTKQISLSTTSNVPLITNQIETLPKAITVMVKTTKMPVKIISATEVVTNTFAGGDNVDITKEHLELRTSTPIITEYSMSGNVDGVKQNVTAMPITSSTEKETSPREKVSTNIGVNLGTTPTPVAKNNVEAIKQAHIKVDDLTKTLRAEMDKQETNTLISTTTTTTSPISTESTTKRMTTKPTTTQKVDTDSGIIFIDDASDNQENRPNKDSEEFQNDEGTPVAGRHNSSDIALEDADGVNNSKDIIKLIDLEKHDLKSIAKAKQHKISNDDDGHDGIKRTRKKQLTDKHYLVATELNACTEICDATSTAGAFRKEFVDKKDILKSSTESVSKENNVKIDSFATTKTEIKVIAAEDTGAHHTFVSTKITPQHAQKQQDIKNVAAVAKPTLKPVHNGYLGPILMEEKVFSVFHANRKPYKNHESTIESQLRNGRLVEILAPTALLEQTATKSQTTMQVVTDLNKEPAISTTIATHVRASAVSMPEETNSVPMLSTTVFQVPETLSSTTRLPLNDKIAHNTDENTQINHKLQQQQIQQTSATQSVNNARTESKISDIQVEVYDSTVDSIIASTNFKDSDVFYALPHETEKHLATTKPPAAPQERFTQYVVDRVDYGTQEASPAPLHHPVAGLPEPAAIEIHINVSEGIGNESEDLEFSYRQPDYAGSSSSRTSLNEALSKNPKAFSMKSAGASYRARINESNNRENIERGDEILVVEIIDTGENRTETAMSAENVNPIFTFRSDPETDVELKDIKYFPPEIKVKPPQMSDELFLADMKRENALPKPPLPPPPPPRKPTIDRDSDTIFYISNTEVKVGESLPTTNTNFDQQQQQQLQLRKTKLENQFFPANYLASTHPNAERLDEQPLQHQQRRYEEDIIHSPIQNTADSLKIFRSQGDGAPPLDVTYVGESVMEVEQSSGAGAATTTVATSIVPSLMPDVIIQPAILPEMSIGVPVIGELPPQIELKEIDFMPDEANQQHSGIYESNMLEEKTIINGKDVDRIVESSVQYGGDLIDESAGGGGFDGVEGSYPFGNPAALHNKAHHVADYARFIVNHGVNNLRKDELSVDVVSSGESMAGQQATAKVKETVLNNLENDEMKELLERNSNESLPLSMLGNGSYPVVEHMSNATGKSVVQESNQIMMDEYSMLILILIGLLLFVLVSTGFCALWIMYIKYQIASVKKPDHSQRSGNVKSVAENRKSEEKFSVDVATSIPKQQPPSSNYKSSNRNLIEATQATTEPSSYTNIKNISNGTNSTTFINFNAKSVEEVLLLPSDEPIAIPTLNSVSTPLKPSDNNKLKTEVNVNPSNKNSVQDDFTRPNGSVTKMTLKNNHLIVETEERHDISRVARETTMHYNTSEKDGVFVVEVARGIDSKSTPNSPSAEDSRPIYETLSSDAAATTIRMEDEKVLKKHDEIQIHQPPPESIQQQPSNCMEEMPERSLHQIIELEEPAISPNSFRDAACANEESTFVRNSNTGLSQSDLSSTSSVGSNKRYTYGNQELYNVEPTGYVPSPTTNVQLTRQYASDVAEDDDRRSENGHSLAYSTAAEGNNATAAGGEQVPCNNLANNEQNGEQEITESAAQAADSFDESVQAHNNTPEVAEEVELKTSTSEAALPAADDVMEVAKVEQLVEVEVAASSENIEATGQTENMKAAGEEENEKDITVEPGNAKCIKTNNNTIEDLDEKPKLGVCTENASKAHEILPLSVHAESIKNEKCEEIDSASLELTNGIDESPHAFPQTTLCNYGYDSIISLPDPPSTEEIKQLSAFTILDNNQLDSLPPPSPPPPPTFADMNDNTTYTENETNEKTTNNLLATEGELAATQLKLRQIFHNNTTDVTAMKQETTTTLTNGNSFDMINGNVIENGVDELGVNGQEITNGHEHDDEDLVVTHAELNTSSSNTEDNSTGIPLTPPASPPLSSPLHCTHSASAISVINGVNRSIPVVVNVNGS